MSFDIETIYPYGKYLFLGTKTGLYIYSIETADEPKLIGEARHAPNCDPVVVNDSVAFVTLQSSTACGPAVSGLYVHDIKNLMNPVLKRPSNCPIRSAWEFRTVFCTYVAETRIKGFQCENPYSPGLIATKSDGDYMDVIPYNGNLICAAREGIILYDITDPASPVFIKNIAN